MASRATVQEPDARAPAGTARLRACGKPPLHTVLVTGCSRGLGEATMRTFLAHGWRVAATAREPEAIVALGGDRQARLRLDVTSADSIAAALAAAVARFGGLDVVVNSAGFGAIGPFETIDRDTVRAQFEVVTFGAMAVIRAALPILRAGGGGTIVNITSETGRIGYPYTSVYAAAKHAVEGFSEALRYEVAPFGIRLRIVEPGRMRTRFEAQAIEAARAGAAGAYPSFAKMLQAMRRERDASDPADVAAVVYRAATSTSDRLRWRARPTFLHIGRLMPDRALAMGFRYWLER